MPAHVHTEPRLGPSARSRVLACAGEPSARASRTLLAWVARRTFALALTCGLLAGAALSAAAGAAQMPRISVHGSSLYTGAKPWRAWGMNWGVGDHAPVISYFDDPSAANFAVLRAELRTARRIGANSMRIYLQLGQVMATPTRPRQHTLTALQRLLALAQRDGVYLDITGDLVWRPSRAPTWYGQLSDRARWQVQARFWKAVAHAAAKSPAVLCYELTSEPIVAQTPGYYYGQIGDWYFVQSIATQNGRNPDTLARSWTRLLAAAVRSQDDRPVSIGLLPLTTGPFAPANIADLLDILIVHDYPTTGQASAAISLIRSFASHHKPVLLGETFVLQDDAQTQGEFLTGAAGYLTGTFEFFDGRDPATIQITSIYDAIYQQALTQFTALRNLLLDPPAHTHAHIHPPTRHAPTTNAPTPHTRGDRPSPDRTTNRPAPVHHEPGV